MTRLLDINVLLAIVWPQHVHYRRVNEWLVAERAKGKMEIATSPITQLGFVRISLNIKGYAQNFQSAMELLHVLIHRPEFQHEFWPDSVSLLSVKRSSNLNPDLSAGQLTDFYLVSLAKDRSGRLATFDEGIKDPAVELIP